jgi:RNA polymerase sigma-70 factor (ECF subfamily)
LYVWLGKEWWVREASSFDAFYAAAAPGLTRQLFLATGDLTRAEDCVQEAFMRAWRRWELLDAEGNPTAWVRTVAFRLAINDWRRMLAQARALVRHGPPRDVPPPAADLIAVRDELARLPQAQRITLVLHYFADMPVAEIATLLEVAEGTVKARLSRGREALAARLTVIGQEQT